MSWSDKAIALWVADDLGIAAASPLHDQNCDPGALGHVRKRRRDHDEQPIEQQRPPPRKRRILRERMPRLPRRGGGRAAAGRGRGMVQQHEDPGAPVDVDATPRAPPQAFSSKRRWLDELQTGDARLSKRSDSAGSTTTSSRTGSPTKPNILRSLPQPIRNASLDTIGLAVDDASLLQSVRHCAAGFETVPEALLPLLQGAYPNDMDLLHAVSYDPRSRRARLGAALTLHDVSSIVSEACECRDRSEIEAAWDTHVVGPLLVLARALSSHRLQVGTTNVTTAKSNPRYQSMAVAELPPVPGKVVDFVLFLASSATTLAAFRHLPFEPNHGRDFNHTLHAPIAERPIAVSMETKREGEGQIAGQGQLLTWVAAHYNRLQRLCPEGAVEPLPTLPLLLAQGPIWSLSLAQRHIEGAGRDGEPLWTTIVYDKVVIGDATKASGVCKIVAVLQLLFEWMETKYRAWFESLCERIVAANANA